MELVEFCEREAQVGDRVVCRINGFGKVVKIDNDDRDYPIKVKFKRQDDEGGPLTVTYTINGKEYPSANKGYGKLYFRD